MKAVQWGGLKKINLIDIEEPSIVADDDVKVKVEYCGICADEKRIYSGEFQLSQNKLILGHEMSGTIVECGKHALQMGFRVGDRVSADPYPGCGKCYYCINGMPNLCLNSQRMPGTMVEYFICKDHQLCKLADKTSLIEGCFAELVSCCVHTIELSDIKQGGSIIIFGAGGAGLILLQLALLRGASNVTMVEPIESKRALALKLGANYVINPNSDNILQKALEFTNMLGYDTVIDAAANPSIHKYFIDLLGRKGTLLFFSLYSVQHEFMFNLMSAYTKELTIRTSFLMPFTLSNAVSLLPRLQIELLATRIIHFTDAELAFKECMTGIHPRVLLYFGDKKK